MSTIYSKLFELQQKFQSNKDCKNEFGGFNYRNVEKVLTDLKPMLAQLNLVIIFNERVEKGMNADYIVCKCSLIDIENGEKVENETISNIDYSLPKMCGAQSTGSDLSYIRKYCLGGLLGFSAEKDPDSMNNNQKPQTTENKIASILDQINGCSTREELKALWDKLGNWTKNQTVKTAFSARKGVVE